MITSAQAAALTGNQISRFGNLQSYAQQISPAYPGGSPGMPQSQFGGMPPPGPTQQRQSFNFGFDSSSYMDPNSYAMGNRVGGGAVAGMGTALPMGVAAAGLMGAFGNVPGLRMLDPFTGTMRAAGMGMRAGGLAGGAAMGGAAIGAYALGGAAISYMGDQAIRGAHQYNQGMNIMGSQMGFAGGRGRSGFGASRGEMGGVMTGMRGLEDAFMEMSEVNKVMDRLGQSGFGQDTRSAREFGDKMKKAIATVKEISRSIGTTLEEAVPLFEQARRSGIYNNADIMRNAMNIRTLSTYGIRDAGNAQVAMAEASVQGGATRRQGAQLYTGLAGLLGAGQQRGMLNNRLMQDITGLEGGAAAGALAQRFGGQIMGLAGRNPGMFLGTVSGLLKEGTTDLDPEMVRRFSGGEMNMQDVVKRGSRLRGGMSQRQLGQLRSRGSELIGEAMAGERGGGFIANLAKSIGEDANQDMETVLTELMGFSSQEARIIEEMGAKMGDIMKATRQDRLNTARSSIKNSVDRMERTISGRLRNMAWDYVGEPLGKPARAFGQAVSQEAGWMGDDVMDVLMGQRNVPRGVDITRRGAGTAFRQMFGGAQTGEASFAGSRFQGQSAEDVQSRVNRRLMDKAGGRYWEALQSGDSGDIRRLQQAGVRAVYNDEFGEWMSDPETGERMRVGIGHSTRETRDLTDEIFGRTGTASMQSIKRNESELKDVKRQLQRSLGGLDPDSLFPANDEITAQKNLDFLSSVPGIREFALEYGKLKLSGMDDTKIADAMGITTMDLEYRKKIADARLGGKNLSTIAGVDKQVAKFRGLRDALSGKVLPREMRTLGGIAGQKLRGLGRGEIGGPSGFADALSKMTRGLSLGKVQGRGQIRAISGMYEGATEDQRAQMRATLEKLGPLGTEMAAALGTQTAMGEKLAGVTTMGGLSKAMGMSEGDITEFFPGAEGMLSDGSLSSSEITELKAKHVQMAAFTAGGGTADSIMFTENMQNVARAMNMAFDQSGYLKVVDIGGWNPTPEGAKEKAEKWLPGRSS